MPRRHRLGGVGGDTGLSPEPSDTGTWVLQVEKPTRAMRGTASAERRPQRSRIGHCAECRCKGTEMEMDAMARSSHAEAKGTLTRAICEQGRTETGK